MLDGQQLLDFMEIIEDRHGQKSTIIVSQLPVSSWYDVLKKISPFWVGEYRPFFAFILFH